MHIERTYGGAATPNPGGIQIVAVNTAEVKRFENSESKLCPSRRFLHLRGDFARIDCSKGGEPR
jgi:hypothetical protein